MNIYTLIDNFEAALREQTYLNANGPLYRVTEAQRHDLMQRVEATRRELVQAVDALRNPRSET